MKRPRAPRGLGGAVVCALWLAIPAHGVAQGLPSEPISLANGTVVIGAEVTATIGPDDPGFFNYTDYEYNALRNFRLAMSAEVKANARVQLLAEVRLDQGNVFEPYGFYVRIRPWPARRFDIQAGRVPPTFGAFSRTTYGSGNILIGQPLAYQYLQSIHADALPGNADDLLRMRGRGWLSNFPVGDPAPGPGLPIVNTNRWDTGVQVHGVAGIVEWTGAVTTGSLSDPRVGDNNGGRQLAGRVVARPVPALAIGASGARGSWLDRSLDPWLPAGTPAADWRQSAIAIDAEASGGPALVRGEWIRARWDMPDLAAPSIQGPLTTQSLLVEGRFTVWPGLYLAARGERLDFSRITGTLRTDGWDANTWRVEVGPGWRVTRNVLVKAAWQRNDRNGGRVRRDSLATAQVTYWF